MLEVDSPAEFPSLPSIELMTRFGYGALIMTILLMIEILHYLKDPKLWELWYIPYYGSCRIYIINHRVLLKGSFKGFHLGCF